MNLNQFTQKSLEAVQSARDLAVQNGHQQLEQVHLLLALRKTSFKINYWDFLMVQWLGIYLPTHGMQV